MKEHIRKYNQNIAKEGEVHYLSCYKIRISYNIRMELDIFANKATKYLSQSELHLKKTEELIKQGG